MALVQSQLSKVANLHSVAGAPVSRQMWHYNAGANSVATVVANGYFNDVRGYLKVGDVVMVVAANSAAFRVLTLATVPETGNVTVTAAAFS